MTERWRKKLGDLDAQGPSDDVFERAKQGPMHAEEPLPRVKTSTRIMTAVAAFAVFALAISVFAIPALRMQGGTAAGGSSGTFPLWPSQDPNELRQLQGDADAGGAAWALDPHDVAIRFGQQVMGWSNAYATESIIPPCAAELGPYGSSLATGTPSSGGFVACMWPGQGSSGSYSLAPTITSGPIGAYRSFSLFRCDPRQCGPDVPTEHLSIFQPLEQGDGQIWAVLSALSSRAQLSVVAGQNVRDGASIHASFFGSETPTLAYESCGAAGASSGGPVIVGYPNDLGPNETLTDAMVGIDLDVSLPASASCSGPTPGYVWAVQSGLSCAKPDGTPLVDPIKDASVGGLTALSAVPITALFPTEGETTAATSPPSETTTPGSIKWSTYADPYGWTIDVPDTWRTDVIHVDGPGTQGARFIGDNLSIQVSTQTAESGSPPPGLTTFPQDDSHFPLSAADLLAPTEDGEGGHFVGDGLPFDVLVLSPSLPGPLPPADQDVLDRMISSISFRPWEAGDVRYDWAAIPTPIDDVSWITVRGGLYILFRVADGSYKLYGAISCGGNDPSKTSTRPDGYAVLECPDGSTWEMNAGGASSGSGDAGKNDPPPQWPVINAFDGSLIAYVIPGEYPPGTGLSS